MKTVDGNAFTYLKKQFFKGQVIFIGKVLW